MPDTIVFSVKVIPDKGRSPSFESELRIPMPRTEDEQQRAIERWLDLMASGLRINAHEISATLEPKASI